MREWGGQRCYEGAVWNEGEGGGVGLSSCAEEEGVGKGE